MLIILYLFLKINHFSANSNHIFVAFTYIIIRKSFTNRGAYMLLRCCKAIGLTALAFCLGVIAGLFLPIAVVAILETLMIILLGYCCLFKW